MMKKNIRILIAIICVLAVAIGAIGCDDTAESIEAETHEENTTFLLSVGDDTHIVSMYDLLTIGAVSVSSSPRGVFRTFTGVPLAKIFSHFEIDYSSANSVVFQSLDGFMSSVSLAEALDETNTFIVFEEDWQALGTYEEGGRGPFMVIVALDQFPNRWARYLTEVTLQ